MRDPSVMDFAVAEAEAFLRTVDGSAVQIGYMRGAGAYEVVLFDHPNERCWRAEADDVRDALDHALDLWHVQHPGAHAPVGGEDPRYPDRTNPEEAPDA